MKRKIVVEQDQAQDDIIRFIEAACLPFSYEEDGECGYNINDDEDLEVFKILVKQVMYGYITVSETGEITQKLHFPLKMNESEEVSEIKYTNRISAQLINSTIAQGQFKAGDGDGRLIANIAARSGRSILTVKRLDDFDYRRAALIMQNTFLASTV
jgi:hypothetical protein